MYRVDIENEKVIAFVIYPGLTSFDLIGPLQILTALSKLDPSYRTTIVAEQKGVLADDMGIQMLPDSTFDEVPQPFAVIIPGGGVPTLKAMTNPAIRAYVRSVSASADFVGTVCTGALILASTGALEGKQATTHWAFENVLDSLGAHYVRQRWVENGKFINSAGVSAGIDMALRFTATLTDEATARRVQLAVQYDPAPPFGPIDWDNMNWMARTMRFALSAAAPFLARKPKQLTSKGL